MAVTLKREIKIHKLLKHNNIVRLYTDLRDERNIYLVMEYVPKSTLFKRIPKKVGLPEAEAFFFFI